MADELAMWIPTSDAPATRACRIYQSGGCAGTRPIEVEDLSPEVTAS
jgi:hypothetical protein